MSRNRTSERLDPNLRKLSGILIIGIVAALLDTTVVNVATTRSAATCTPPCRASNGSTPPTC